MGKVDIDLLIGFEISNKDTREVDMRLYKTIMTDFSALQSFWSKAFFIFLLERAEDKKISGCGKKLHFELKARENAVYDRYLKHYITELKKQFITNNTSGIKHNITDSLVQYGDKEFIILNKAIFNCTDQFKFSEISVSKDMRKLIETTYTI